MPSLPPKPCTKPGCKAYATRRGRCQVHQRVNWHDWRNRPERLSGWEWGRIRKRVLERDGYICQDRRACNGLTQATQVDHIKNLGSGGTNAYENLQAICKKCHAIKSREESRRT